MNHRWNGPKTASGHDTCSVCTLVRLKYENPKSLWKTRGRYSYEYKRKTRKGGYAWAELGGPLGNQVPPCPGKPMMKEDMQ